MEFRSRGHVVYSAKYRGHPGRPDGHPRYRRAVLGGGIDWRLKELVRETAEGLDAEVIEIEVIFRGGERGRVSRCGVMLMR